MGSDEQALSTRLVHLPERHGLSRGSEGLAPTLERSTTFRLSPAATEAMVSGEGRGALDIYGRYGTETTREAAALVAELEGGDAGLLFSSGMGAISAAFFAFLPAGSSVAVSQDVYGGTEAVVEHDLPRRGVTVLRFDAARPETLADLVEYGHEPAMVFCESISNPLIKVAEVAELARVCRSCGARLVVDATFGAGIASNPLAQGADLVLHSATKYINGHSDVIAGAAVGSKDDIAAIYDVMVRNGACIDPMGAWLLIRGMRTLTLRFERQCATARLLAQKLATHPRVKAVNYPGRGGGAPGELSAGGGVLSFELGDAASALAFAEGVRVCSHAVSLGGVETLVDVPRTSSHVGKTPEFWESVGIGEGLVRVAVGLEDADDLWADLHQALS
jgi:cystathionine beta-lyase/cystathionine gamma-synthase